MAQLEIRDLSAEYQRGHPVLSEINIDIDAGEIVSVIGPSGSGKSSLLRVIVGLLPPSAGSIALDGQTVDFGDRRQLRSLRDRLAIVFQQFNLFQNMNVLRNVTIAPRKIKGRPADDVEAQAKALLDRIGLGDKLTAYPDELSGGQQQRVALVRALALEPELLLLDEVTSALDPEMVVEVLDAIQELSKDGITMVIVSHEMSFVREVSDRVVMMSEGRIVEVGPPAQIFDNPQTDRCREFVGKILRY